MRRLAFIPAWCGSVALLGFAFHIYESIWKSGYIVKTSDWLFGSGLIGLFACGAVAVFMLGLYFLLGGEA